MTMTAKFFGITLLVLTFVGGYWLGNHNSPVRTAGGDLVTKSQFQQLMQLQKQANDQMVADYAAKNQALADKVYADNHEHMDAYYHMLNERAKKDYSLGIVKSYAGNPSAMELKRHNKASEGRI
jgi:hypothetical protein